ncbi:transcriptional regulator sugar kinase [Lactobacillus delbrueckii subsp. jakobsenii ZN7a-9 = DSM 26046]|nr:transcriptional regulator sugar kinase [Lactobacillus delbrueckii subsp. jakobsenii ZN7a-9 = DSM 26046]
MMTLGTGVGGGIVVGGKLLHGSSFQAGELSWMITNQEAGLKEMAAHTGARCSAVRMVERVNQELGNEDLADGLAAFAAIKSGNEEASKIFPPEIVAAKFRNDTNLYGALFALLQGMQK